MVLRVKKTYQFLGLLLAVLLGLCSCNGRQTEEHALIDSLNRQVYKTKYASLDAAMSTVDEVLARSERVGYRDGIYEALLNKGDVYGMRMDYDSAQHCYLKVLDESDNELLRGIADVDMMSVCLMRSMSKEFYDYRSDAQERFAHVEEEDGEMSEHQTQLWHAVQTECHFVSVNYFMKMRQDEGAQEEFDWLEQNHDLFAADTTQLSAYMFLQSLHSAKNGWTEDAVDEMQRHLVRLLSMSKTKGYIYYEALALNALAQSLLSGVEMKPSRRVFVGEQIGENGDDSLAYRLVCRAEKLARQYGNAFVETAALTTLSDYHLQAGNDSLALQQMVRALDLVNAHHQRVNKAPSTVELLLPYAEGGDSLSTEMRWIADPAVIAVPDWMAGIREQLSIVYGAMGLKAESDYNHNVYFDILDATRQDLRVQQEENNLKREKRMLDVLLWVFVLVIVALAWILIFYNRRSRREYRKKVEMLGHVIDICKRLSSALADDVQDEEDLHDALHGVSDEAVFALFPQFAGRDWTTVDVNELKGLDRELFRVLQVFYGWMRQQGLQFLRFGERERRLESETYLLGKRLEDNKRQYLEKLTLMSIVHGITPFLDRAMREVNKLKEGKDADEKTSRERLLYIGELVNKINDYNEVLGSWVKIRQGMVNLNIENFALQPLFDTLQHGEKTFAAKGLTLSVNPTESVVKADKSLTLFMMNTLLDNARKYTPAGGTVWLSAEEAERYVEVSVRDTGPGMSAADVDTLNHSKVYDSSKIGATGAHAADIIAQKGFGFGLMNCKGIVERYKKLNQLFSVCAFGVENEPGAGCRFFFRLPKGVLKTLSLLLLLFASPSIHAGEATPPDLHLQRAGIYADSVFSANVRGDHEQAILYADSAIHCLNAHILQAYPDEPHLMAMEGGDMGELHWWKEGLDTDYEQIIRLRNEVAIAALALNRNALYHYNSEVFTRLYKQTSTDPTLEEYCNDIKMANRNKKTLAILLGMLSLLGLVAYLLLHYRHHLLFIFNLRQFVQLYNSVFSSTEAHRLEVLHQGLSDIKQTDAVGLMLSQKGTDQRHAVFTGEVGERTICESLMQMAYTRQELVVGDKGHFHAYPLAKQGAEGRQPLGVLGVRFTDGATTKEEALILDLIVQFMSIYSYFSYLKVDEMNDLLELKQDERKRIDHEQQKVYVRNQIMDNTLSTLKHETMYYPSRIKQIVDTALGAPDDSSRKVCVDDMAELLSYYKEIFTLLSAQAGKPGEMPLFKRTKISAQALAEMVERQFKKQARKAAIPTSIQMAEAPSLAVQGDDIYLQILVENILSLYFEHHAGGDLRVAFDLSDGFLRCTFTDTAYRYDEALIPQLFYVDNIRYDAHTDTLTGAQYLICRQIIREHDAHASRRGCRIYVENDPAATQGSRFVFTLPIT